MGDNKRHMVEVAQMMETIMFGLLEPDFYLRRVLGTETTIKVEVLDMSSNTWEEVREMSTSRSALSSGVVTFNSLVDEVREGLRLQKEDEEKMDGLVECCTEDVYRGLDRVMFWLPLLNVGSQCHDLFNNLRPTRFVILFFIPKS